MQRGDRARTPVDRLAAHREEYVVRREPGSSRRPTGLHARHPDTHLLRGHRLHGSGQLHFDAIQTHARKTLLERTGGIHLPERQLSLGMHGAELFPERGALRG